MLNSRRAERHYRECVTAVAPIGSGEGEARRRTGPKKGVRLAGSRPLAPVLLSNTEERLTTRHSHYSTQAKLYANECSSGSAGGGLKITKARRHHTPGQVIRNGRSFIRRSAVVMPSTRRVEVYPPTRRKGTTLQAYQSSRCISSHLFKRGLLAGSAPRSHA